MAVVVAADQEAGVAQEVDQGVKAGADPEDQPRAVSFQNLRTTNQVWSLR